MRRSVYTLFACTFFQASLNAIGGYNYVPLSDRSDEHVNHAPPVPPFDKRPLVSKELKPVFSEADASLLRWASGEYPSRVHAALAQGARVDVRDASDLLSRTALHRAAYSGSRETIRVLLHAGAALEAIDAQGRTPFLLASMQGNTDAARLLLESGARGDVTDSMGNTALHLIAQSKRDDAETAATVLGLCHTLPVDAVNRSNQTASQIAVDNQLLDFLVVLLDQGASVVTLNADGNTLLHQAAGFSALWPMSTSLRIVEQLLKSNAQAAQANTLGKTARELARSIFIRKALQKAEKEQGLRLRRR